MIFPYSRVISCCIAPFGLMDLCIMIHIHVVIQVQVDIVGVSWELCYWLGSSWTPSCCCLAS